MKVGPGTLLGGFIAAGAGVIIFLIISTSTVTRNGIEMKQAAAACTKDTIDCRPRTEPTDHTKPFVFIDTNGEAYPPEKLDGKVLVVNFWATWCHPCQSEIPSFSKVYKKFEGKDVVMLGVMTDNPDPQTLLNFESDHELLYPVVRADKDIMTQFEYPDAIPTTFIYDRKGNLRTSHRGPLSEDELTQILFQLLAEK
jgi:thiol-disulfide isomerase/thioredoxin